MKKYINQVYKGFRRVMPEPVNGTISKVVYIFGSKPRVKRDSIPIEKKFPDKEKGGLIISADFEMSWAWRYSKTGYDHIHKGRIERQNIPKILRILEKYNIPITFATVGHLFLESCKRGDHDWMKRIPYFDDHWKFTEGDWFDHDPHTGYRDAPEWYAPDLIQMILDSKIGHEVGTHTFSHIDFSHKNCPPDVADDEIEACKRAAYAFGIDLKSIVFPGGTWGNTAVLKKHDIIIYRKSCDFELSYPFRDEHNILASPSSGCLEHDLRYGWSPDYFLRRLQKFVNRAIETNTIAHLWFHPSLDPYFLKNIFPGFFEYVTRLREKGDLWVGTMKEIGTHINENRVI